MFHCGFTIALLVRHFRENKGNSSGESKRRGESGEEETAAKDAAVLPKNIESLAVAKTNQESRKERRMSEQGESMQYK